MVGSHMPTGGILKSFYAHSFVRSCVCRFALFSLVHFVVVRSFRGFSSFCCCRRLFAMNIIRVFFFGYMQLEYAYRAISRCTGYSRIRRWYCSHTLPYNSQCGFYPHTSLTFGTYGTLPNASSLKSNLNDS